MMKEVWKCYSPWAEMLIATRTAVRTLANILSKVKDTRDFSKRRISSVGFVVLEECWSAEVLTTQCLAFYTSLESKLSQDWWEPLLLTESWYRIDILTLTIRNILPFGNIHLTQEIQVDGHNSPCILHRHLGQKFFQRQLKWKARIWQGTGTGTRRLSFPHMKSLNSQVITLQHLSRYCATNITHQRYFHVGTRCF